MRNPSSGTKTPCCSKVGIKRGPWTPEEDEILSAYIKKEGEGRWRTLPKRAGLQRCGKSCRLRWMNYLRPCVKRGHIAPDEEDLILRLHRLLGNRWSLIAGRIPGRTDNEIKNYWNTHLSKKLISQGIDPRTHKPLDHSPRDTSSGQVAACDNIYNPPFISNPTPKSNPNSNPQELHGASSSHGASFINKKIITNPNLNQYQCAQTQSAVGMVGGDCTHRGILMMNEAVGDEDRHITMCNEDTFSSFLDSLINESAFATHQQQHHHQPPQLPPVVSSAHAFDQGSFWEAELMRTTMDPLGDMQNGFNNHHHTS